MANGFGNFSLLGDQSLGGGVSSTGGAPSSGGSGFSLGLTGDSSEDAAASGAAKGAAFGPWGALIGAAVGLAKSELIDKPRMKEQLFLDASTARLSPFTGLKPGKAQVADPFGQALQFGAAGAGMGQSLERAGIFGKIAQAKIDLAQEEKRAKELENLAEQQRQDELAGTTERQREITESFGASGIGDESDPELARIRAAELFRELDPTLSSFPPEFREGLGTFERIRKRDQRIDRGI
jgi:hypothetical protein